MKLTGINKSLGIRMNKQHSNEQWQHGKEWSNNYCNCLDAIYYDQLQLMVDLVEDEATCNSANKVAERRHSECP